MSISERYNKIINAVHEVCTTFLKPPRRKSQYWFSSEDGQIDELLETRRKARREYLQTNKQESKDSYKKSKSAVRQALRTMENNFWKKKCEEMHCSIMQREAILTSCTKKSNRYTVPNNANFSLNHF